MNRKIRRANMFHQDLHKQIEEVNRKLKEPYAQSHQKARLELQAKRDRLLRKLVENAGMTPEMMVMSGRI